MVRVMVMVLVLVMVNIIGMVMVLFLSFEAVDCRVHRVALKRHGLYKLQN